eukprot:13664875-Ditylum_brightwellii.AAC.1
MQVECGDAWDFIAGLGMKESLPHHLIMNYPSDAPRFLDALRWWPCGNGEEENYFEEDYEEEADYYYEEEDKDMKREIAQTEDEDIVPTIHVYTFARGDDDNNDSHDEIQVEKVGQE